MKYGDVNSGCAAGPAHPVRGMYFASHFHNFYHNAPSEQVDEYLTKLAEWGCNALMFWFDMHHYQGLDDPRAAADIARLKRMARRADALDMNIALLFLANEGYDSSPQDLRADWTEGHDGYHLAPRGHYHREICPNIPGGMDYILKTRREALKAFRELPVEYVCIWPYDQGGCTCTKCAPWGANGFLKTAEPLAGLCREVFPGVKVILSTWYFDRFTAGEWSGLASYVAGAGADWIDYLLCNDRGGLPPSIKAHGVPGDLPVVSFPEISMRGMLPWGGFGANPMPRYLEDYFNGTQGILCGSFPYSEGIFEDLNKFICLRKHWNPATPASALVREYAASEFDPAVADEVTQLVYMLESTLCRHGVKDRNPAAPLYEVNDSMRALAPAAFKLAGQIDRRMPAKIRRGWRWQVLYLRARMDCELAESGGRATAVTEKIFGQLSTLYCVNAQSRFSVSPPSRAALLDKVERKGAV